MKTLKALLAPLAIAFLLCSCASTYHPIEPASLQYLHHEQSHEALSLGYRYHILTEKNNKKLSKAEDKKSVRLVAVEITNNSSSPLTFGEDFTLSTNGLQLAPMSQARLYNRLKQKPGFFMFYLSMMQFNITTETTSSYGTKTRFYPIGLILGPAFALGNFFKAKNNNKNFQAELNRYNLTGKVIQPGETVYGLVGLTHFSFNPLEIYMKGEKPKEVTEKEPAVTDEYYIEEFDNN